MCEAYAILVKDLKKLLDGIGDNAKKYESIKNELLKYVPMGDNYCADFHGCDNNQQGSCHLCALREYDYRLVRDFNKLKCYENDNSYYHNSFVSLREHLERTHPPINYNVIVHPHFFEKIKKCINSMDPILWIELKLLTGICYKKCSFDSSKKETYEYHILTHRAVNLLNSTNPIIQYWLNTVAVKGCARYDEKSEGSYDPESYESLYKSTRFTIRQHLEMFKRDSKQCNYNTVNFGTEYSILMYQNQFDLLKSAYLNDKELNELNVQMIPVSETNAIHFIDKEYQHLDHDGFSFNKKKLSNDKCTIL